MAGAVLGSVCYQSADAAIDAFYSGSAPSLTSGATSYLTEFVKESGVWLVKNWSINSSGTHTLVYSTAAVVPTFPECDPAESFLDGVSVGWGIAAALVAVGCFKLMQRAAS